MVTFGNNLGVANPRELPDVATAAREELHAAMREAIRGGHPGLLALIDRIDLGTLGPNVVRYLQPADPWATSRVTLLGDAIHAMPPSFGAGANSALRDAAALVDAFESVVAGEPLLPALAAYEARMRDEVFPILRASADPDAVRSEAMPDLTGADS
jgi:2-polyprenyl-6-methoxyphenol hydroxylase-like FAD-dependent oxidoreductase